MIFKRNEKAYWLDDYTELLEEYYIWFSIKSDV
jgi:hypothetical protein